MSIARQRTFMAGCLARVPFREQLPAVAGAGFDSMTSWPNIWRHALRKDGLSLADMGMMVRDHGLVVTDLDSFTHWMSPSDLSSSREYYEVAEALGATTLVALHWGDTPLHLERDTESFARACDQAAEHGLRLALEFVAFSNIRDVATAWALVGGADRANGGLVVDNWHHARAGGDDEALRRVPPEKVFTVQLSDGPHKAAADLEDEARLHRLVPGEGELDVARFVSVLEEMGVRTSVGLELDTSYLGLDSPTAVTTRLMEVIRRFVETDR